MIGNLRIKSKIMLIAAAGLAGLIVVVGISLFTLRGQMFSERQVQTRHHGRDGDRARSTIMPRPPATAPFPTTQAGRRPWPR